VITAEQNKQLTETGPGTPMGEMLRRYWWPIAATIDLDKEPVQPIRLLSEDLTLFRDEQGRLGLIGDKCAHRAISLAYGIPQENGLRCCYHGWTYDTEGRVVDMPFEPACLPLKIKSYVVEELGGLVWAYLARRRTDRCSRASSCSCATTWTEASPCGRSPPTGSSATTTRSTRFTSSTCTVISAITGTASTASTSG
jgi:nitrite reductase/ring-hydroxylating ferredoxin subunit